MLRRLPLLLLLACAAFAQGRPNILVITADNLGYSDLGCYGNPVNKTPNIDRLAAEGVRLTSFYTAGATCTVSRATLLTGRYPQSIGLNHQLSVDENRAGIGLPQREKLIPQYLKPLGYATACFGKWNIGFAPGSRPTERGFDEFLGIRSGNADYYTYVYAGQHDLYRGVEPAFVSGHATDLFAEAACDFMRRKKDQPFFIYLPFNAVHYPAARNKRPGEPNVWQAPPKFFFAYGYQPDTMDEQQRYRAAVTALDDGVGRVLEQLEALDLAEDTIVILYSDNGAFMSPGKGLEVATNKPLRDGGNTLWDGGIRVAGMARWPGRIPARSVNDEALISLDVAPTVVAAAGGRPADVLEGRDVLSVLAGEQPAPDRALYWDYLGYSAIRRGPHKLLRPAGEQTFQLFDVKRDVGETTDLAPREPALVARLRAELEAWLSKVSPSK
ncbi:MAG: sulfatase-like hydrolase/transferase [Bryobacterales bacterium]|nr:sulfatase-like hydrolase/transferase [Acidobacteriota bacterium]MCB9383712.1 sulfatase-like hydrolase/transferase [Bryobacterales bacterium]